MGVPKDRNSALISACLEKNRSIPLMSGDSSSDLKWAEVGGSSAKSGTGPKQ